MRSSIIIGNLNLENHAGGKSLQKVATTASCDQRGIADLAATEA